MDGAWAAAHRQLEEGRERARQQLLDGEQHGLPPGSSVVFGRNLSALRPGIRKSKRMLSSSPSANRRLSVAIRLTNESFSVAPDATFAEFETCDRSHRRNDDHALNGCSNRTMSGRFSAAATASEALNQGALNHAQLIRAAEIDRGDELTERLRCVGTASRWSPVSSCGIGRLFGARSRQGIG
jgi:hypothetical protein